MTQELLKKILHYNPQTGIFIRLIISNNKQKINEEVGAQHHTGYKYITINKKTFSYHQLAWLYMTGEFPTLEIDHINRIRNDNRWVNLREVSKIENMRNVGMFKNNISTVKGVRLFKRNINGSIYTCWLAFLKVDGIFVLKKYFQKKEDAIMARREAEQKHGIT